MNHKIGKISVFIFLTSSIAYSILSLFVRLRILSLTISIICLIFGYLCYLIMQNAKKTKTERNLLISATFHNPAD